MSDNMKTKDLGPLTQAQYEDFLKIQYPKGAPDNPWPSSDQAIVEKSLRLGIEPVDRLKTPGWRYLDWLVAVEKAANREASNG